MFVYLTFQLKTCKKGTVLLNVKHCDPTNMTKVKFCSRCSVIQIFEFDNCLLSFYKNINCHLKLEIA